MFASRISSRLAAYLPLLFVLTVCSVTRAQTTPPQKPKDDVVRVYTELVQTDVMVFDKQGRFVDGLSKDNFELRIDGKPRSIEAFDKISAGSDEESQLAAARGATTINLKRPVPLDRGRIVFFFVDDFHMDLAGLTAAKKVITTFIDREMGQNDQAAIASATGQIGFLQQLTSDRMVLRLALNRLTSRPYSTRDPDRPQMSEYEALLIDRLDRDVFEFFVTETIRLNPGMTRDIAGGLVRARAQASQSQGARLNQNTLSSLEKLVQSAKSLPGRKVLFFLSGGFLIENRRGDAITKMREIANAAGKSGVVIYSMDTRGLIASLHDVSIERPFDPFGRLTLSSGRELSILQDPLNALAVDTGGKAVFNTNDLKQGLAPALKETSTYYLLAWKPDAETQKQGRFRNLEIKLVNRPDLTVRVRKGYFDLDPTPAVAARSSAHPTKTISAPAKLREAIVAPYPERELPILMSADYYDIAGRGPMVSTAVQMPGEFLVFGQQPDGKIQAIIDLNGVLYDEKGVPKANFLERIVTTAPSLEAATNYRNDITFTYPAKLTPGLYQVRVAARDDKSGKTGSAHAWIEVPDLANKKLTMSSLLLGERLQGVLTNVSSQGNGNTSPVALSASHRFSRESTLRFLLFAYNTVFSATDQKPDAAVQVQVIRDDQPVITTALRKINTDGVLDLTRLPYAAEIPLGELLPGRYLLQVSVIDRVSKQSTSRKTHFDVY